MATEELRLEASVVDRFSTPLQRLRTALGAVKPPQALLNSTRDFERFNAAVTRSTQAIQGGLGSALAGVGVQSLAAVGGIAAVTAAIARFAAHSLELKEMNRQTGISMRNLQALQGVAQQFGSSSEAVSSGLSKFAQNFYDVQRGISPLIQDLLNADPSGKLLQHFKNPDRDKALSDILSDLGEINKQGARGAETARRLSGMIFGSDDFAKMTADIERFKRAMADAAARTPVVTKEEFERALAFNAAVNNLRNSMSALATTVGTELAPPMTKAIELIDQMIKESRGDIGQGLADGVKAVGNALKLVDWDAIGKSIGGVASSTRDIALMFKMMEALSRGDAKGAWDAFNSSSGRVPADIKTAREEVERRKKALQEFDKTNPNDARRRWHEENLRGSEEKLKKALEEGAKLGIKEGLEQMFQKSSYGSGVGGGAPIWNASLGGGGLGGGGLGGSGYGGAGRRAAMGLGVGIRGGGNPAGGTANAAVRADMMGWAMDELRKQGVPEANLRAAAAHLVGQADAESGLRPGISHDGGTGYGIYGARLSRRAKMLAWLGANNFAHDSAEGQMRYMAREAMSGAYPRTRRVLMGATPERLADDQWTITREFEAPAVTNDRSGAVARAYGAGVAAGRGGLPSGGYWAKDSKGNPVAVGPDGHAVQGARRGSAFNAARQTGAFGLSGPVARSGEASLSVHITADGKVKTQADGGELFNRVDVDRGRTVSAEQ